MAQTSTEPDAAAWAAAKKHEAKYKKPLVAYFSSFAVKERGLKKWIEKARTDWISAGCPAGGPEFPPFDEPERVLAWWLAHMTRPPSSTLLELAGKSPPPPAAIPQGKPPATPSPPAADNPPPPAPPPRAAINIESYQPLAFVDAVQRQGRYVAAAMAAYDAALARGGASAAELNLLAKERDSALEKLRTCQRDFDAAEIERGDRVHLNDLKSELAPLFAHLATSFVELLTSRLGLPRARARTLADEWFADLRASRFAGGAAPPSNESAAA